MISADAKDALARELPQSPHCRAALLSGLAIYGKSRERNEFVTHRHAIARLFWSLLEDERKLHPIETRAPTRLRQLPTFAISLPERLRVPPAKPVHKCDRLMEIRAAFLACGSLAAGAHGYHLEFVPEQVLAMRLDWTLRSTGLSPKTTRRKGTVVLYYKDFETIVELLTLVGAFGAVLRLEDVRALRETKNRIHRLVNTETANLERVAQAAAEQRRVIEYLRSAYGLARLSPALREIAELRLTHPDESLAELGRRCNPPIAKPTVSSRLAGLARLAGGLASRQGQRGDGR